jgi:hypothetical protein
LPIANIGSGGVTFDITALGGDGPVIDDTTFGLRSLSFDNADDLLTLDSIYTTAGKAFTLFAVIDADAATKDALFRGDTSGEDQLRLHAANQFAIRIAGGASQLLTTDTTANSTISYTFSTGTPEVIVMRRDTDGFWYFYNKDGDFIAKGTTTDMKAGAVFKWGSSGDHGTNDFGGNIAEIGLYNEDIGVENAQALAAHLNSKWS